MAKNMRKKRERRILIVAMLTAFIIAAGGTFAWFSSKDEVTNKLVAEQGYNVVITENFTTPSTWTPGQLVKKEVGVLNAGTTDAFVRVNLEDAIEVCKEYKKVDFDSTKVENYKTISLDEALALQAGGINVVNAGTVLTTPDTTKGTEFQPVESGLYVFERNLGDKGDTTYQQFAGYFYDKTSAAYYVAADLDITTDTTTGAVTAAKAKAFDMVNISKTTGTPTFDYTNLASKNVIVATYDNDTPTDTTDDIVINIMVDPKADWTFNSNNDDNKFYYNKVLGAGKTTQQQDKDTDVHYLITAVELDKSVSEKAYVSFEYSLTVNLDSVQTIAGDDISVALKDTWSTEVKDTTSVADDGKITWAFN